MLQPTRSTIPDERNVLSDGGSAAQTFTSFIAFARRQLPTIAFVVALTVALGLVYLFTTPPRFTAQALLVIDTRKVQVFQQQSILGDVSIDSATVDTQVEILKAEKIALAVIKDLRLTEDPEFVGGTGGLLSAVMSAVMYPFSSQEPTSEFALTRRGWDHLQKSLTVKRVGLTYIISIDCQAGTPQRAAQIANALADAYIVDQLEAKYQATRRAGVWLQDRIKELREQASIAERSAVEFKAKNNIIDTGGRLMNEQQLAEVNSQLILARAQTAEAKARLDRINDIVRMEIPDATVTDTLKNDVITKLRQQYLEIQGRVANWSGRYGSNHLAVVNLRNQMRELRSSILDELGRIAQTFKSDYEISKAREESVQASLSSAVVESRTTSEAQVTLRDLEGTAQTYRALYDNFLQRYMESVQQQSFPISEARLVTEASQPLKKSSPRTLLVLALTLAGGLILGLGIAMLREFVDRVFRTSAQIETHLQTDCLAVLPLMKPDIVKNKYLPDQRQSAASAGPRSIVRASTLFWTVVDAPFSRFAESMRSVKVAIDLNNVVKSNKIVAITSSLPNEGKSTIAAGLAQLMANSGGKVILVDCDLRNPALTRELTPDATLGLLDVLAARAKLEDVIWTDRSTKLAFLPAVLQSRVAHTSEILGSGVTKAFFDRLRDSYDYIVVDLSPLAPVVDVRRTTHFVDSFVFVVEWGRTRIEMVDHTLRAARGVGDNLLGVVLNKADVNVMQRYENYGGNYYRKYYARYGYIS